MCHQTMCGRFHDDTFLILLWSLIKQRPILLRGCWFQHATHQHSPSLLVLLFSRRLGTGYWGLELLVVLRFMDAFSGPELNEVFLIWFDFVAWSLVIFVLPCHSVIHGTIWCLISIMFEICVWVNYLPNTIIASYWRVITLTITGGQEGYYC